MPNGSEFQQLAAMRLEEAQALSAAGKHTGCVYLCGYVVELALKACICKTLDVDEYPEKLSVFKTHDIASLVLLAGLRKKLKTKQQASERFSRGWRAATQWKPELRYTLSGFTAGQAQELLNALTHSEDGVLTWLTQQW